jgi:hypothetical protein
MSFFIFNIVLYNCGNGNDAPSGIAAKDMAESKITIRGSGDLAGPAVAA